MRIIKQSAFIDQEGVDRENQPPCTAVVAQPTENISQDAILKPS